MRCAQVGRLVDALVDGRLADAQRAALEEHAAGCDRCARSVRRAQEIREAFRVAAAVRAPAGFAERVMAGVYEQALRGLPLSAGADVPHERVRVPAGRAALVYRRMALSFLLTAGVLAFSLLIPRLAYPAIVGREGTQIAQGSTSVVRGLLSGADRTVRGALGESATGGNSR